MDGGLWPSGTHQTGRPSWPKWSLCPPVPDSEVEEAEKKQPVRNWPRISLLPSPAEEVEHKFESA